MADVKISQLPEVPSVSTGDILPVVASGVTSKIQIQNFGASITASSAISASYALTASYALNGGGGSGQGFPFTGSAIISGSLIVTGSIYTTSGITGSLSGTSSWAINASTASYANQFNVNGTDLTTQTNSDVDIGTETVATISTSSFSSAFFDYYVQDGTNYRAGTVSSVWNTSGAVRYTDVSTTDIGNTSGLSFAVILTNSTASLQATATSNNWNIKTFVRAF